MAKTLDHQLRQSGQLLLFLAHREHQRHRLRQQAPRHERQRLRRRPIQPLRIIDHADQRALRCGLGQQPQHGQPHEEAIRRVSGTEPKRRAKCLALGARKSVEPVQYGRAQPMQPGKRKLHLGLHTRSAQHLEPRRPLDHVVQQRRLAHTRLTADYQNLAPARLHNLDQPVERLGLVAPALQDCGPSPRAPAVAAPSYRNLHGRRRVFRVRSRPNPADGAVHTVPTDGPAGRPARLLAVHPSLTLCHRPGRADQSSSRRRRGAREVRPACTRASVVMRLIRVQSGVASVSADETVKLRATETMGDRERISVGSGPSRTSSRGTRLLKER